MEENQRINENPCSSPPNLPPEMIEKILQYLPLKDLLSCRLVWKDHDDITKEAIAKKMKPIVFNVETAQYRDHLKNCPNSPVPDELQLKLTFEEDHETIKEICENLRGKIKHLKIDMNRNSNGDWKAEEIIRERVKNHSQQFNTVNARLLIRILEILGGSLETLEFGLFKSGFLQVANKLATKSAAAGNFTFPSLQKITISGEPPDGKYSLEKVSLFNRLIFENSSGKLKSFQNSVRSAEANILKDLKEVGRLTQITSLGLHHFDEEYSLNTLLEYEATGGLQIEELFIKRSCGPHKNSGKLERVLKMQSKKLKIFSLEGFCTGIIKIPVMERLTSLKLIAEKYHLENICFKKITPNLKVLEVRETEENEWMNSFFGTTEPLRTLQTLKIHTPESGLRRPLKLGLCEILARNFPSITSLTLAHPGRAFLHRLWTAWPDLLNLDLALGRKFKNLDKSLFGITREWMKSVNKKVDQWWTLTQPPPDSQIESICNLKKLQVLRIYRAITPKYYGLRRRNQRQENLRITSNFSKFSYYYGLKNMKNLKLFSMNQGPSILHKREISSKARNFIRKELPSLRIHCKREKRQRSLENFGV